MKKITLLFILLAQLSFSQSFEDQQMYFEVNAGVADDVNENTFLIDNSFDIKSLYNNQVSFFEISFGGSDLSSFPDQDWIKTGTNMSFKYFYPIYSTDSIKKKFSGNLFGLDFYGINFLAGSKIFDFTVSAGVNMGSKKVRVDNDVKYKNFIFAPRATAEFRIIFNQEFGFNFKAETQFDLTKDRWKLKKGENVLPDLKGFKYNPFMLSAGISYRLL